MFDVSFGEIGIIFVVAIIVVGPEKMPHVVKTITKTIMHIRKFADGFKKEVMHELNFDETFSDIKKEVEKIKTSTDINSMKNEVNNALRTIQEFKSDITDITRLRIEKENVKHLATGKPIKQFSFQDVSDDDDEKYMYTHEYDQNQEDNEEDNEQIQDYFHLDELNLENKIFRENMNENIKDLEFKKIVQKQQYKLNTSNDSRAKFVYEINEKYKNRQTFSEHELLEKYQARIYELSNQQIQETKN